MRARNQLTCRGQETVFKVSNCLFHFGCHSGTMRRITEISWKLVQRINIHFCVKLGWTLDDTFLCLQHVFRAQCLHRKTVKFWYDSFVNGRTRLVDQYRAAKRRTGRSQANIQAVRTAIEGDRSLTLAALHWQTNIPVHTIQRILTKDLKLRRRSAKLVPANLTANHLRQRLECSQLMLRAIRRNPGIMKKIMTTDKTWVYMYDPLSKMQTSQWLERGQVRPTHPRRGMAVGKCMLITFCDWRGMIHHEFVRGHTINAAAFIQILGRLHAALRRKRPRRRYYLHMDNASPHTAHDTRLHLLFTGTCCLEHPLYSLDLAPSDFWLFPRIKHGLKGWRFQSLDALEAAVDHEISLIPSEEYRDCFTHRWPMRWARCVFKDGDYFEGLCVQEH